MTVPTLHAFAVAFCERHGIRLSDLRGPSRCFKHTRPRLRFIIEARAAGRWSTTKIGQFLGGRDHSTIVQIVKYAEAKRTEATPPLEEAT